MFVNWTSFINNKYRFSNSGQAVIILDGVTYHITLGTHQYPNSIRYYDDKNENLDNILVDNRRYKDFLNITNGYAITSFDINNDGYEEILTTHNKFNSGILTLYYYNKSENKWASKIIKNPMASSNTCITVVPNGFLIGNSSGKPYLMRLDANGELKVDTNFVSVNSEVDRFNTRSIVNFKGLINGIDGFVLNGENKRILPKDTYKQYYFIFNNDRMVIKPWLDTALSNTTSITFVNINPSKEIYGYVFGNWGHESYLYMFKRGVFLKKHTFTSSYCTCVIAADFDNDGKDEILFVNGYLYNTLYRVSDENNIEQIQVGQAYNDVHFKPKSVFYMLSAAVMDLDKDGFLEVYTTGGEIISSGNNWFKVGEINRTSMGGLNRYLRIAPINSSGTSYRGAVVKARFNGKVYKRIIDNGGNAMSQSEPVAHFGLGSYSGLVDITVKWTDGTKKHIRGVEGNKVLKVVKGS
jgi:hypothetical protein